MCCCKCCFQNDGSFDDRKMYRLPTIKTPKLNLGEVSSWDIYCEECAQEWLEEFRTEEE